VTDTENTGRSYVKAALWLFAIALIGYGVTRLGGKWLFARNNAEYLGWLRAEWIEELVFCAVVSTVWALWGAYREWKNDGAGDNR
jgi:hypothetical protein